MKEMGWVGALAVPTQLVGYDAYMSWAQVKKLAFEGWEITAHSRHHECDQQDLSEEVVRSEVVGSKEDLEQMGIEVSSYVLPCGTVSEETVAEVKRWYLSMRTSEGGMNALPVEKPYELRAYAVTPMTGVSEVKEWLAGAKRTRSWLVLMFHQVDDGGDEYSVDPVRFRQITEAVKESKLPVVKPSQALGVYIK
jgi:hypothetical protein